VTAAEKIARAAQNKQTNKHKQTNKQTNKQTDLSQIKFKLQGKWGYALARHLSWCGFFSLHLFTAYYHS
jgi:hypothetical protein